MDKKEKNNTATIFLIVSFVLLIISITHAQVNPVKEDEFLANLDEYDWDKVQSGFLTKLDRDQIYDNFDKAMKVWKVLENNGGMEAASALEKKLSETYGYKIKLKGFEKASNGEINSEWENGILKIGGKTIDINNKIKGLNEIELKITQEGSEEFVSLIYKTDQGGIFEIFKPVSIKSKTMGDKDFYEIGFKEGNIFINSNDEYIIGDGGLFFLKGSSILTGNGDIEITNSDSNLEDSDFGVYEIISDTRGILYEGMEAKKSGYAIVKSFGEPALVAFDDEEIDLTESTRFNQYQDNYIRIGEEIMEVSAKDNQIIQLKDFNKLLFKENGKNSFVTNGATNIGSGETENEIISNPRRPVTEARYNIDEIETEGIDQKYQLIKSDVRTEGPKKGNSLHNGKLIPIKGKVHMGNLGEKVFDPNSGQKNIGSSNFNDFDNYLDSEDYRVEVSLKADSDGFLNLNFPATDDNGEYFANYRFTGIDKIIIKRTGRVRGIGYSQYSLETYNKQGKLIDSGNFQFHDGGYINPDEGIIIKQLDRKKLERPLIAYPSRPK